MSRKRLRSSPHLILPTFLPKRLSYSIILPLMQPLLGPAVKPQTTSHAFLYIRLKTLTAGLGFRPSFILLLLHPGAPPSAPKLLSRFPSVSVICSHLSPPTWCPAWTPRTLLPLLVFSTFAHIPLPTRTPAHPQSPHLLQPINPGSPREGSFKYCASCQTVYQLMYSGFWFRRQCL